MGKWLINERFAVRVAIWVAMPLGVFSLHHRFEWLQELVGEGLKVSDGKRRRRMGMCGLPDSHLLK